jgi:hypothetical protein
MLDSGDQSSQSAPPSREKPQARHVCCAAALAGLGGSGAFNAFNWGSVQLTVGLLDRNPSPLRGIHIFPEFCEFYEGPPKSASWWSEGGWLGNL